MLEIASQMILCLLLAALLGLIIGYILGKASCSKDEDCGHDVKTETLTDEHQHTPPSRKTSTVHTIAPVLLAEARDGKGDDLTRIKGIGEKINATLNDIGIYHFDQIAAWTEENMIWADNTLEFPGRAKREQWVAQAKALAETK